MLKHLNITYELVDNGLEVCELVEGGARFDLILMDCEMPVLDGSQLVRLIRKLDLSAKKHSFACGRASLPQQQH